MSGRILRVFLAVLFISVYIPLSARAQGRGTIGRDEPAHLRDTREAIRRTDDERTSRARTWATARNVPRRIRQEDGRTIELVNVIDGRPVYITSFNTTAARVTGTSSLYSGGILGLSLSGNGMFLGIWDEGVPLTTHQELAGRVTLGDQAEVGEHATHVAGTLIASGVRTDARGMAYRARLHAYDWSDDASEMSSEGAAGLLLSNHSYGAIAGWFRGDLEGTGDQWYWLGDPKISSTEDFLFGRYIDESLQFDRVVYSNPYLLPVVAAGNDRLERGPSIGTTIRISNASGDWVSTTYNGSIPADGDANGYDSMAGAGIAKNVLTVGSIGNEFAPRLSGFSSNGPTDDGRIKPDLVGYGERLLSAGNGSPTQYLSSSGTSMATPNVAGSLLLLQEHYQNVTGRLMRASTLKALAIHTARDLGNPGPDYQTGWGLLDATAAATMISQVARNPLAILEDSLRDTRAYTIETTLSQAGPLRVTLAWTDVPGNAPFPVRLDDSSPQLRNDLDVQVIHEATGQVFRPFVLNRLAPAAAATTGDNTVDPVEQVYVPGAPAGSYRVVVQSKYNLSGGRTQVFSLLMSGLSAAPNSVRMGETSSESTVDQVTLNWQTLFEGESGTFHIRRAPIKTNRGNRIVGASVEVGTLEATGPNKDPQNYTYLDRGVLSGNYLYWVDLETATRTINLAEIEVNVLPPDAFAAVSNFPNPFSSQTRLVVDLPETREIKVEIYDVSGRRVARVLEATLPAGRHELPVDGSTWPPGIYFARISSSTSVITHRLVIIR